MQVSPFVSAFVGHLVGDFLVQNDFMAAGKTKNTWICLIHVVSYTITVGLTVAMAGHIALATNPLFLLAIFLPHFAIDRFRLARQFMRVGQEQFATGSLSPWSIIVVDQCWHILCLFITILLF